MSNDSFHVLVKHREPQRHHWLKEVVSDSPELASIAAVSDYGPDPWIRSIEIVSFCRGVGTAGWLTRQGWQDLVLAGRMESGNIYQ